MKLMTFSQKYDGRNRLFNFDLYDNCNQQFWTLGGVILNQPQ